MSMTLAQIQTDVQFLADESTLALTGQYLPVFNGYYKEFCASRLFPELNITDTSITTVAGQEAYVWPKNYKFLTEPAIILQRTVGNPRNFVKVWPVQDEIYWGFLKNVVQSFPSHYKKERQSANMYNLLMRPLPNISGLQVLIVGQTEPVELVQASDPTVFNEPQVDRAFARFVAAQFQMKRGNPARAAQLLDEMDDLLPEGNYGPTPRPNNAVPWLT